MRVSDEEEDYDEESWPWAHEGVCVWGGGRGQGVKWG